MRQAARFGFLAPFCGQTEAGAPRWPPSVTGAAAGLIRAGNALLAGDPRCEKRMNRLDDRIRCAAAPSLRGEQLEVLAARHVAEFDQHRGYVRGLENAKTGRFQRMLV